MHPYSSSSFQTYKDLSQRHYGLGDLNLTNKQNNQPSLIDRLVVGPLKFLSFVMGAFDWPITKCSQTLSTVKIGLF
jgi:hypothetical protein